VNGLVAHHDVFDGVPVDRLELGLPLDEMPHQRSFHNAAIADYVSG
jgi:hypothetical protein